MVYVFKYRGLYPDIVSKIMVVSVTDWFEIEVLFSDIQISEGPRMATKRSSDTLTSSDETSEDEENDDAKGTSKRLKVKVTSTHKEFNLIQTKLAGGGQEERSQCNHCSKSYKGKNPTTLNKHLRVKHPKVLASVKQKDDDQRKELEEVNQEKTSKASSNQKTAVEAIFGQKNKVLKEDSKQKKLLDMGVSVVKRSKSLPPRPKEKEERSHKMLALWVGSSTLPVSMVEDSNFEAFLRTYDPQV